ncbi:MAG: DUF2784 family protein [Bacteroidales bacterium]|nr:DUF2784 family protein [Bacteroidales bacterium]
MVILDSTGFLQFVDLVLDFSHIALMLFIVFGWLMPRLRLLHLSVVLVTGSSWLIFAHANGLANCILTDWHYQILRKLGETNLPETYAQYTLKRLTGISIQKNTAFTITRLCWLISLIISSIQTYREHWQTGKIKCINSHYRHE